MYERGVKWWEGEGRVRGVVYSFAGLPLAECLVLERPGTYTIPRRPQFVLKVTGEPADVEGSRLRPRILGDPDTLQSLSSRSLLGEWSRVLRGGEPKLSRLRRMGDDVISWVTRNVHEPSEMVGLRVNADDKENLIETDGNDMVAVSAPSSGKNPFHLALPLHAPVVPVPVHVLVLSRPALSWSVLPLFLSASQFLFVWLVVFCAGPVTLQ